MTISLNDFGNDPNRFRTQLKDFRAQHGITGTSMLWDSNGEYLAEPKGHDIVHVGSVHIDGQEVRLLVDRTA
jgi:hypothetical protein